MRTYEITWQRRPKQPTAVSTATLEVTDIGSWLADTYHKVARYLATTGTAPAGPPFGRYHRLAHSRFQVEAGFPVPVPIPGDDDVRPSSLPGGAAATLVHIGPYDTMEPAYEALTAWVNDRGGELAGDAWEVYFSDPASQPDPTTWRTEIVQPFRESQGRA